MLIVVRPIPFGFKLKTKGKLKPTDLVWNPILGWNPPFNFEIGDDVTKYRKVIKTQ